MFLGSSTFFAVFLLMSSGTSEEGNKEESSGFIKLTGKLRHKQAKDKRPSVLGFLKERRQGLRVLLMGLCWAVRLNIPRVGPRKEGSSLGFVTSNLGLVGKLSQGLWVSICASIQRECHSFSL